MERTEIGCCIGLGVIFIILAIAVVSFTYDGEKQESAELFFNVDESHSTSPGEGKSGILYIDLVSVELADSGYDEDLNDVKIDVNVTDLKTCATEHHTLNYTGHASSASIKLAYGKYLVSAEFGGNWKYKPAKLNRNITLNDTTVLKSRYSGDYRTI